MIDKILNPLEFLPRLPLGDGIEIVIEWLKVHLGPITRALSEVLQSLIVSITDGLIWIPPLILIILFSLIAWRLSNRSVAAFSFVGLILIYNFELWPAAMQTLSMVVLAAIISICIGIPMGIAGARSELFHRIVWPILDLMQTLPAFVYLIPAVFFFRMGEVPAVMATVVFAIPPVIRLTGLGIRQVPSELVEACGAFGTTGWQKLVKVQLPLAMPTIMAGVNQCIMLSLSMVVIAAMIGAPGLGTKVWGAIQRMNIGGGFESGLAVVVLAIILDRITQNIKNNGVDQNNR